MKNKTVNNRIYSYLVLGSNKGHRKSNINRALKILSESNDINVEKTSSLYITKPWGYSRQNNFYNMAAKISTTLSPVDLLKKINEIENIIGKEKEHFLGPRRIDIDIALYGNKIINDADLTIPHKDLTVRDFFIVPIIEIDKDAVYPVTNKKLEYYLNNLKKKYIIKRIKLK